jgi:flagellar hook-length control protein FliK
MLTGQSLQPEMPGINTNTPLTPEQNAQLLQLQDSIQIPGSAEQQGKNENPAALLNALLTQSLSSTTPGKQQNTFAQVQSAAAPSLPETAATTPTTNNTELGNGQNVGRNTGQPELTIENWRAQFNYQRSTDPQEINSQKISAEQLQYGEKGLAKEPVFAYATPEVARATTSRLGRSSSGIDINANQRQDANSQFIHSNLPGFTAKTDAEGNSNTSQQQTGNGQTNLTGDNMAQAEQAVTAKAGSDTPLIFSLDQVRAPGLAQQSQSTSASQMLRLPSGTEVPHAQIVDQVIDRFTMNRTLKSGAIALRLHPAELGELRMEIKVEQDNIKAHITTQNPQVQEILDRHLPKLRAALEQQGLHLDQMEVTVGADDSNSQLFQEHFNQQQAKPSLRSNKDQAVFSLDTAGDVDEDENENTSEQQQNLNVLV